MLLDIAPQKLLPAGVDAPSSFETVGHVVHLNLRDEQLPYKHVIGQVRRCRPTAQMQACTHTAGSIQDGVGRWHGLLARLRACF
jgi:tRNA G37 N-methylase Trm5